MFAQAATTELTKAIKPAILGKEEGGEGVKRNWVKSGKARKLIYFCMIDTLAFLELRVLD